jgi:hypothetical protein
MVTRQLGGATWNEHLRTVVRRYGYGTILVGSLLVGRMTVAGAA